MYMHFHAHKSIIKNIVIRLDIRLTKIETKVFSTKNCDFLNKNGYLDSKNFDSWRKNVILSLKTAHFNLFVKNNDFYGGKTPKTVILI